MDAVFIIAHKWYCKLYNMSHEYMVEKWEREL